MAESLVTLKSKVLEGKGGGGGGEKNSVPFCLADERSHSGERVSIEVCDEACYDDFLAYVCHHFAPANQVWEELAFVHGNDVYVDFCIQDGISCLGKERDRDVGWD